MFKLHLGEWFHFQFSPEGCLVAGLFIAALAVFGGVVTCGTINHMFSPACGAGGQCYIQNTHNDTTQTLPTPLP